MGELEGPLFRRSGFFSQSSAKKTSVVMGSISDRKSSAGLENVNPMSLQSLEGDG